MARRAMGICGGWRRPLPSAAGLPLLRFLLMTWRKFVPSFLLLLAACGGGGGGAGGGGGSGGGQLTLTSLAISPSNPTLVEGTAVSLALTGTYSDGSTRELAPAASWVSNMQTVATVTGGTVSAVAAGTATISATYGGFSANTVVTVKSPALTYLHYFGPPPDANQPNGPLLLASDGNFYGTSRSGGANMRDGIPCGAIFKITPDGKETVISSFGISATDSYRPNAALIQGKDGALYGTTSNGGTYGQGTVFRVTLAGVRTILYSFGATPNDGIVPTAALIQADDGNFYGTTTSGGANHSNHIPQSGGNAGTVFRVTPQGVETVMHSFGASVGDGVEPLGGLVQANDGNFYGTTIDGGANTCGVSVDIPNSCGTVFKMTPAGVVTVIHSFGAKGDGVAPQGSLVQGPDGALYGTTPSGGVVFAPGGGTVFRVTLAGAETVLHGFGVPLSGGEGPSPFLTVGSDGNLYGTTRSGGASQCTSCGTVFRITTTGAHTVLASFGPLEAAPNDPGAGVTEGKDGALYGVTFSGPSTVAPGGTVFKLVIR